MKNNKTRVIAVTGIMGAVGAALMFLEIPLPFMPSFIKFDFSDLPGLITSFAFGPVAGVIVSLIKNLIHLMVTQSAGVGELSNFIIAAAFTFTAGIIYKFHKTRKGALIASICAGAVSAGVSVISNYFIIYPIYYKLFMPQSVVLKAYQAILPSVNSVFKALIIFNLPFTFVKNLIIALICFLIYKRLSPILKTNKKKINKLNESNENINKM
jgi:riboflavin transporter FmnP